MKKPTKSFEQASYDDPELDDELIAKKLYRLESELAQIQREINSGKKEIQQIENSRTWKMGNRLKSSQAQTESPTNEEIQNKLASLQSTIYTLQTELNRLRVDDRLLSTYQIMQILTDEHQKGNLIDFIEELVQQKIRHDNNYLETFHHATRLFNRPEMKKYQPIVFDHLIKAMAAEDVSEPFVRSALTDEPLSLQPIASFRGSLTKRIRQQQLDGPLPDWALDEKSVAYDFIDRLNVRRPRTSEKVYTKDQLPLNDGTVIKPIDGAGARGVYLIHTATNIIDIKRNQTLQSTEALLEQMQKDLQTGWVKEDAWGYEELIYENQETKQPARDLKFYSFYGKTPLVLEIIRYPEMQYCWWTAEGQPLLTGKYNDQLFQGDGFTPEELEQVNEISRQIPSPFLRIDFLKGEDGLVFGEFTPKPGNYDEFDESIDRWLGDCFLEAESRLTKDLLRGKKFDAFSDILKA